MNKTVKECMDLDVFKNARLLAGAKGVENVVTGLSVLDMVKEDDVKLSPPCGMILPLSPPRSWRDGSGMRRRVIWRAFKAVFEGPEAGIGARFLNDVIRNGVIWIDIIWIDVI